MNPITREEQYLNRLTGEEGIIPDKPVTREEQYFARLCGGDNVIPDKPVTRREQYLATLCGEDVITPTKPVTRIEQYMAFASGESESKPEKPITREEMYWDKYQGGDVPEEKTIAFTDIITVTDALARPAVDLQSEITATQNLNGYEYPWVGGAGKNLYFSNTVDYTSIGVNLKTDGNGKFEVTGTSTGGWINPTSLRKNITLPIGTYIISASISGTMPEVDTATLVGVERVSGTAVAGYLRLSTTNPSASATFTIQEETVLTQGMYFSAGEFDAEITIQIELGSTATEYEPYENICPISGRTEVNVKRTGVNIWDEEWEVGLIPAANGQNAESNEYCRTKNYIDVSRIDNVYFSIVRPIYVRKYDANKNYLGYVLVTEPTSCHIPSDTAYLRFCWDGTTYNHDISINYPSTATEYEPYEGDTFNTELGRTVYGGTLDLTTGKLTLTHAYEDLYSRDWLYSPRHNVFTKDLANRKSGATNFITTNYRTVDKNDVDELLNGEITGAWSPKSITIKDERATTVADFIALLTDAKICYELATPQTISLTPTEVMMLENNNTIWADSGRVQLTYLSRAAEKVQLMNASLKANTLKLTKGAIKE